MKISKTTSYLDLLLSIESEGQLRTSLYDKRDDFNFHITNFPFLSSNIPSSPAYGVFISQLIRYVRACSSYGCFILRAARHSSKVSARDISWNFWNRPSGSFMVDMGISSNIMKSPSPKCYMTFSDMAMYNDTLSWSDITPICELVTELDFITDLNLLPNFGGFHRTLQRVRLANRGRLLLWKPGPVPFGTCICTNVENIPELVMSTDILSFEHPSVLPYCFNPENSCHPRAINIYIVPCPFRSVLLDYCSPMTLFLKQNPISTSFESYKAKLHDAPSYGNALLLVTPWRQHITGIYSNAQMLTECPALDGEAT